ncbi:hypothetical protein BH09SUM1_BH09SUM1_28660 [soil metagenome]
MKTIRAIPFIYFDAGFTLIRPAPSVGHHYGECARRFGVECEAAALDASFVTAWKATRATSAVSAALPHGRNLEEALGFWTLVVKECFRGAGHAAPADPRYYQELFDLFADAGCWALYEDVPEALRLIEEAGARWGVLSNWDPRLHSVLRGMGLAERASAVVISSEAGAEKPSPEIFLRAQAAAGVADPANLALIGDEPSADGHGALAAGWRQCLVWRHPTPAPAGLASGPKLTDCVRQILGP